jgi:hypothetical protein
MKQASGPAKKPAEAVIKDIRRATLAGPFCEKGKQAQIKARCREYYRIPDITDDRTNVLYLRGYITAVHATRGSGGSQTGS